MTRRKSGGVVIGRFMPPHRGHCYLIDFARNFTPNLTLFVCTLHDEPIPGVLRYEWVRELYPAVRVIHITEEIPEASRSSKGAQKIWATSILHHLDTAPEYVFASEEYGVALASALGAKFVPVDPHRSIFPISAGMIRKNPLAHWAFIPSVVRPYYVCRISVVADDPDVIRALADLFETIHAADYLAYRQQLSFSAPAISSPEDLLTAQEAAERALLGQANRVIFLESDLLRSILTLNAESILTRLADGWYDDALERSQPDLVIGLSPFDSNYRDEMERRGWAHKEIDLRGSDGVGQAESIVHDTLDHHRQGAERKEPTWDAR